MNRVYPAQSKALTIAGSDSGGGAGIQADLKTFMAMGVYGTSVVTALTAQNSVGVQGIWVPPADFVRLQFESIMSDIGCDAAKIGMLANAEIIEIIADCLTTRPIEKLVVDPVMISTSGHLLLEIDAIEVFRRRLLVQAWLLAPNLPEAEALTGMTVRTNDEMASAARELVRMGARAALVKGGHADDPDHSVDVSFDDGEIQIFESNRVPSANTHGSGCTLSAAIAALAARGETLEDAIRHAKQYVTRAIEQSYRVGQGPGPLNHSAKM